MIPESLGRGGSPTATFPWVLAGFIAFFALEQLLHWHHCHRASAQCKKPMSYLILIGDGVHNWLDGLAVASAFVLDIRLGLTTLVAVAAHEVPQELGDFAVLVHGGWSKGRALFYNVLSQLSFLAGGLITYTVSAHIDVSFLLPFAAGNFLYIGASDLVPEVNKHENAAANAVHLGAFALGIGLMFTVAQGGR
jgi:zinc and cadmium transporter